MSQFKCYTLKNNERLLVTNTGTTPISVILRFNENISEGIDLPANTSRIITSSRSLAIILISEVNIQIENEIKNISFSRCDLDSWIATGC
jgi:hypothetical protein